MRLEISSTAKTADRKLVRLQTYVLDSMAPLTAVLDSVNKGEPSSAEDTFSAVTTAIELLCIANARISCLRREKIVTSLNKTLLPIVQEGDNFMKAVPHLFGPDFVN